MGPFPPLRLTLLIRMADIANDFASFTSLVFSPLCNPVVILLLRSSPHLLSCVLPPLDCVVCLDIMEFESYCIIFFVFFRCILVVCLNTVPPVALSLFLLLSLFTIWNTAPIRFNPFLNCLDSISLSPCSLVALLCYS